MLSKQVISYWNFEKLYSEKISKLLSKPAKTILQEYREKIEKHGFRKTNHDIERSK